MDCIAVKDLIERLDQLHARGPIPFDVKNGEILGILCPCDQSRRTLIAILTTMLFPNPGFAENSALAIFGNLGDVRRSMGIILQDPDPDPARTARENLEFYARVHGLDDKAREKRISDLIELFDLSEVADTAIKTNSLFVVRRLGIARAYVAHPHILFLSEPVEGLDGSERKEIQDLLRRLNRDRGVTIIFTTHNMTDTVAFCDRVAVMDGHEVVALDTPETFCTIMKSFSALLELDDQS